VPNALYVQGAVEQLPAELCGIADAVYVTLPWGSLMRGIILGDAAVLRAMGSLARPNAEIRVVLNTRIFEEPVPIDARDLPEVTPEYVRSLAPSFAAAGLAIEEARTMPADEVAVLETTWAKRLSHRQPPPSVYVRLRRGADV
jgi:16S rRNA (adenine(1408)-N(1))-methyltransferase